MYTPIWGWNNITRLSFPAAHNECPRTLSHTLKAVILTSNDLRPVQQASLLLDQSLTKNEKFYRTPHYKSLQDPPYLIVLLAVGPTSILALSFTTPALRPNHVTFILGSFKHQTQQVWSKIQRHPQHLSRFWSCAQPFTFSHWRHQMSVFPQTWMMDALHIATMSETPALTDMVHHLLQLDNPLAMILLMLPVHLDGPRESWQKPALVQTSWNVQISVALYKIQQVSTKILCNHPLPNSMKEHSSLRLKHSAPPDHDGHKVGR